MMYGKEINEFFILPTIIKLICQFSVAQSSKGTERKKHGTRFLS